MSSTIFNNHPLIQNANQYYYEKKYISIHSEDRDLDRYPNSSVFEIELPQDYINVASARLFSWSFPANYNVFSIFNYNVAMTFKLTDLYNPGEHENPDILADGIFAALYNSNNFEYVIIIETGFYNPDQMAIELSNKFNEAVTNVINNFFELNPSYEEAKKKFVAYNRFKIVYNSVSQKLWFGNSADAFVLTNDSSFYTKKEFVDASCFRRNLLPQFSEWGLPAYLGFTRCPSNSLNADKNNLYISENDNQRVPRFYYGDVSDGDNGYWILPSEPGSSVQYIEPPFKISFMGPAYFYMEIDGLNCIDETSPWYLSQYMLQNNSTNGIVNSSFAKIAIPTTPLSQWFDEDTAPYKYFNPPAERLRKLNIRLRYHNGQNVDFGQYEYSFMIELNLLTPQQQRTYSIRDAYSLSQTQSF